MNEAKKIEETNPEINSREEQFSDFIEAAAHDLQAPLRKLSTLIDRVFTKNAARFDEDAKQYIQRIETCIVEMKTLIHGLTELAKTDKAATLSTSCDLHVIARQAIDTASEEVSREDILIHIDQLPVVHGNMTQYKQLFKNLFENAIKFSTGKCKIEVTARLATEEEKIRFNLRDDKKYYRIEIADNGVGFNQDYAEKIFEPFVRLHPRSQYEGNGLGLFICKKIVHSHHGIIYAEGHEKKGSRFALILPETP